MSQIDLANVWITHLNFAITLFVAFLSATSALLIVAHFKGSELQRSLYRIITALYCVSAVFLLLMFGKTLEAALDIRGQMVEAEMVWYNTVYEPQMVAPTVFTIGLFTQVLLAAGALWYFRSTRRR
jgi:hypothetical protein